MEMPDVEKLLAKAAKLEERKKKELELNPFGTGLKVKPADDDMKLKQITGSTAGAGSGEFHLYRNQRRKELTRLGKMNDEAKKAELNKEFLERKKKAEEITKKKAAKNAAKRAKQKQKQLAAREKAKLEKQKAKLAAQKNEQKSNDDNADTNNSTKKRTHDKTDNENESKKAKTEKK